MSHQPGGEETYEFSPIDAARAEFIQDKFAAGWTMKGATLVHPSDADLWLIPDPESGELAMSPKLADRLDDDRSASWMLELLRKGRRRIGER